MEDKRELREDQEKLEKAFNRLLKVFYLVALVLAAALIVGLVSGTVYFSNFDRDVLGVFNCAFNVGAVSFVATAVLGAVIHCLDHTVRGLKREIANPLFAMGKAIDPLVK